MYSCGIAFVSVPRSAIKIGVRCHFLSLGRERPGLPIIESAFKSARVRLLFDPATLGLRRYEAPASRLALGLSRYARGG